MLLAAALAVLLVSPQDSASVRARLTAGRIATGGTTVLAIEVTTSGATPDDIPVPVLPPGLDLGQISDFSELQVAFPGGRRRITRREVAIIATSPGSYRIPAAEIRVAGRTLRTASLQLVVSPLRRGAAEAGLTAPVRLRARVIPETVFIGQQVLYEVEAVFPEQLRLRQARPPNFEPPVAAAFWTYDLPEPVTVNLRLFAGGPAEVQQFRQVLFPLAEGRLMIPPARLQYEIRQGRVYTPQVHSLASESLVVRVLPLPAGAPPSFAGAVGRFSISAVLSATEALAGEPVTMRLTVEGNGNIKAVTRPALDSIPGLDTYPGAERLQLGFARGEVSGRKVFEWTVVARGGGVRTIPPVRYAWFDPELRHYRVATTPALRLAVRGSPAGILDAPSLAPLQTEQSRGVAGWVMSPGFAAVQLVPPIGLIAVWLRRQRNRRLALMRARPADELRRASTLLDEPHACLEQLALWLRGCPGTPEHARLLERVRLALYAPAPPGRAECEEYLRAAHALETGPDLARAGTTVVLVLLTATLIAQAAAEAGAFERGVSAFHAGDYGAAAGHFARHVQDTPQDAAGWYDLGNAAFFAREPGHAAWAWAKALQLRPRDRSARNNLRAAGAHEALAALGPRVPLANAEAVAVGAVFWWLCCGSVAYALVGARRRRFGARSALVALLVLLPLLALLAGRALLPSRGLALMPTNLQGAPTLRAGVIRSLPAAAPLVVLQRRGEWLLVRSYDLRHGWVEVRSVGML